MIVWSPHLIFSRSYIAGYVCTFLRNYNSGIVKQYTAIVEIIVKYFSPLLLMCGANIGIIIGIQKAKSRRAKMIQSAVKKPDDKTTKVLVTMVGFYLIFLTPTIIIRYLFQIQNLSAINFEAYLLLLYYAGYVNYKVPIILRFGEFFIYLLMIQEFRCKLITCFGKKITNKAKKEK